MQQNKTSKNDPGADQMDDNLTGEIIACHECDHLYRLEEVPPGARADCKYCGSLLYRNIPNYLERSLALYITSFILFILANTYPFLSLEFGGRVVENVLLSGGWALYKLGMGELGLLVFLTSIAFPFVSITGMIYLLAGARSGRLPPAAGPVYRIVKAINPWSMTSVFMLGVLIAIVKLQDLANVIPGISLYAICGLLVSYSAARANFDPVIFWSISPCKSEIPLDTGQRILNCHNCGMLNLQQAGDNYCRRCQTALHHRKHNSVHRTWALIASAAILLIPANVYPVLTVIRFGKGAPDTILSGIKHLIEDGMWGLGMIVFIASIVVPVLKLAALVFLQVSLHKKSAWRLRDRTQLYRITEIIGAWSMVDIFLVALLSGLVTMGALTTIRPGIGAIFFGAVVVITMFAASSFDPRLIWDQAEARGDG